MKTKEEIKHKMNRAFELLTGVYKNLPMPSREMPTVKIPARYYYLRSIMDKWRIELNKLPSEHFVAETNDFNKIIIGHNTTTWTKADKKQSREILKRMESRRIY